MIDNLVELSAGLESLVAKTTPAVVAVESGAGQGSGIIVAQDGFIVTNAHVVDGTHRPFIRLPDGQRVRSELVGSDSATDLAVLKTAGRHSTALTLAETEPRVGQLVLAIGNHFVSRPRLVLVS